MNNDHCDEESDWTTENVHKLFSQMKDNIPLNVLTCSYSRGLKHVDWNKVAFPPFSAEACQQKWKQHLDKMRKVRSLCELIVEAEDVLSNPLVNPESHPDIPKRPPCPAAMFCAEKWTKIKRRHPEETNNRDALLAMTKRYCELSEKKRARYSEKFQLAYQEYREKKKEFRQKSRVRLGMSEKKAVVTKKIDGLPPKPPANGYMLFCKEHPVKMPSFQRGGNVKNWAQGWRDLTNTERTTYNERANEMKREYTVKLKDCLATLEEKEQEKLLESNAMYISKQVLMRGTIKEPEMPPDLPNEMGHNEVQKRKSKRYSLDLRKWFETLTKAEQEEYRTSNPSKCIFLKLPQTKDVVEDVCLKQPSDSEEEDPEGSNSEEEEEVYPDWKEEMDEKDEEDGDITFDLF